jgi:regulator of nucleoside diphosphate kinase
MVLLTEADFANLSLLPRTPEVERLLACATIVASDAVPPDLVTMNTQVVLRHEASGERRIVRIVYPGDAVPAAGLVSVLDPLGTELLGASPGHVVQCGLRVERVIYQPERSLRDHLVTRR